MNKKNWIIVILFVLTINFAGLALNWPEFFCAIDVLPYNLMVSIIFLLSWFLFSLSLGSRQGNSYLKFILIYWGIGIICFILFTISRYTKFDKDILIPFALWYDGPIYGLNSIFPDSIPFKILYNSSGLIVSCLGYWLGRFKYPKNKK